MIVQILLSVQKKEKLCTFDDEEHCRHSFKYALDEEKKPILYLRSDKGECA